MRQKKERWKLEKAPSLEDNSQQQLSLIWRWLQLLAKPLTHGSLEDNFQQLTLRWRRLQLFAKPLTHEAWKTTFNDLSKMEMNWTICKTIDTLYS